MKLAVAGPHVSVVRSFGIRTVCAALALLVLNGCASSSGGDEVVVVRDLEPVRDCRYVGAYSFEGERATQPNVESAMRRIARSQGGDTVRYAPAPRLSGRDADEWELIFKPAIRFHVYDCSEGVRP